MNKETSTEQNFTDMQLYLMGTVYDALARMLPVEGRDYNVEFVFDSKDKEEVQFTFKPHTELGKLWCDYCSKKWREKV